MSFSNLFMPGGNMLGASGAWRNHPSHGGPGSGNVPGSGNGYISVPIGRAPPGYFQPSQAGAGRTPIHPGGGGIWKNYPQGQSAPYVPPYVLNRQPMPYRGLPQYGSLPSPYRSPMDRFRDPEMMGNSAVGGSTTMRPLLNY